MCLKRVRKHQWGQRVDLDILKIHNAACALARGKMLMEYTNSQEYEGNKKQDILENFLHLFHSILSFLLKISIFISLDFPIYLLSYYFF